MIRNNKKRFLALAMTATLVLPLAMTACKNNTGDFDDGLTVTLDFNNDVTDGSARSKIIYADENGKVEEPKLPTATGYNFLYWTTDKNGGSPVDFNSFTITSNTTLYAQWQTGVYDVTFNWNFENAPESVTIKKEYNTQLTEAELPAEENYPEYTNMKFNGWTRSAASTSTVSFPVTIYDAVSYYAYWIPADTKFFTVTFNSNADGVENPDAKTVMEGEKVTEPDIARSGYKFVGWATSPDSTETVKFPYTPTADVQLYAIWQKQTYNVRFVMNCYDGTSTNFKSITGKGYGEQINEDEVGSPTREGYEFTGWYAVSNGGDLISFPVTVTRATIYYAHWRANSVTTNVFDAEFTILDPNKKYYGYSNDVTGYGIICSDTDGYGSTTQHEAAAADTIKSKAYHIAFLYEKGDSLKFEFEASAAVNGATLKFALNNESSTAVSMAPTGTNAVKIIVNGTELNYSAINLASKAGFAEYSFGNINLKEGLNTIELVIDNTNAAIMGGTMKAWGPMVDYMKIDNYGSAVLSWNPEYDNLRRI